MQSSKSMQVLNLRSRAPKPKCLPAIRATGAPLDGCQSIERKYAWSDARLAFTALHGHYKGQTTNVIALGRRRTLRRRSRWRRVRRRWISWWRPVVWWRRIICEASAAPGTWVSSRWARRASAQSKSTDKQSNETCDASVHDPRSPSAQFK